MFRTKYIYFFLAFCISTLAWSQVAQVNGVELKKEEKENRLAVAFGANLSSVNLSRNYRENPYKLGFDARAYYDANKNVRLMAEYCFTPKFSLDPTWIDVHSQIFNASINLMAHIKDQDVIIYTITGLCIQRWKGFYTGQQDYSSAHYFYDPNTIVLNRTLGLDIGLGFERPFPGFNLYGDFRYRFATVDHAFGITDAAYNIGLKFPIFKEDLKSRAGNSKNRHKRNKGSDKYHWF